MNGNDNLYTIDFTPNEEGECKLYILENVCSDVETPILNQINLYLYDNDEFPTIVISSNQINNNDITNKSNIQFDLECNDKTINFDINSITIKNGKLTNFLGSDKLYSVNVIPVDDGECSIYVNKDKFTDLNNNYNLPSNIIKWYYDSIKPDVIITSNTVLNGNSSNASNILLNFKVSELTNNFNIDSVSVDNGTISNFLGKNKNYTATFYPENEGVCKIQVLKNKFTDIANNGNNNSNIFIWTYDTKGPKITISSEDIKDNETTNKSTIRFNIESNKIMNQINTSNIVISGGTLSNLKGSGSKYTVDFSTTVQGQYQLYIPKNIIFDNAGNYNEESNIFSYNFDSKGPNIIITSSTINNNSRYNKPKIILNFKLNENSKTFNEDNITINGGLIKDFSGENDTYSATFIVSNEDKYTVYVPEKTFTDTIGNYNAKSNIFEWTYDKKQPNVNITSESINNDSFTKINTILFNFNIDDVVNDFVLSDITVYGGTITNLTNYKIILEYLYQTVVNFVQYT